MNAEKLLHILKNEHKKDFKVMSCLLDCYRPIGKNVFLLQRTTVSGRYYEPEIIDENKKVSYVISKRGILNESRW